MGDSLLGSEKSKLNWLRAAVLGANDGVVSIAGLVVGVAGATNESGAIAAAGIAGLVAGALSMAAGEYVSVSSQRDAEKAYIAKEKMELQDNPEAEMLELVEYYERKGLKPTTAKTVAKELTDHDVLAAHLEAEYGLQESDLINPMHAAWASAISFVCGGMIPITAVLLPHENIKVPVTFISVIFALCITGYVSAKLSDADVRKAIRRVVIGGIFAMAITYIIGRIFGVTVG